MHLVIAQPRTDTPDFNKFSTEDLHNYVLCDYAFAEDMPTAQQTAQIKEQLQPIIWMRIQNIISSNLNAENLKELSKLLDIYEFCRTGDISEAFEKAKKYTNTYTNDDILNYIREFFQSEPDISKIYVHMSGIKGYVEVVLRRLNGEG